MFFIGAALIINRSWWTGTCPCNLPEFNRLGLGLLNLLTQRFDFRKSLGVKGERKEEKKKKDY